MFLTPLVPGGKNHLSLNDFGPFARMHVNVLPGGCALRKQGRTLGNMQERSTNLHVPFDEGDSHVQEPAPFAHPDRIVFRSTNPISPIDLSLSESSRI